MNKKFVTLNYFKNRFTKNACSLRFQGKTPDDFDKWQQKARQKLYCLLGMDKLNSCRLEAEIISVSESKTITEQNVIIQVEPKLWMPFVVLIPKQQKPPFIPIIAAHGHGAGGKISVAKKSENPEINEKIRKYNYSYGRQLCKDGFMVFCPDARGFGERKEATADPLWFAGSCQQINNMAIPLGLTLAGMWAWDISRLIDYIFTLKECRQDKLGCVGLSGGGLQTLYSSAIDTRITASVISGYFYGFKESLLENNDNCSCNYIPNLWNYFDAGDIASLIAPRKLLVETGDKDNLNGRSGINNVIKQFEITRKSYDTIDKNENLVHKINEGRHRWFGTDVEQFLN